MRFAIEVDICPLEGIADPQARTIERALPALGFEEVSGLSVGKVVRFDVEASDETAARETATLMCERLLANPVIEEFEVRVRPRTRR